MKFYQQYIAQAMVAQGEGDAPGAQAWYEAALEEAGKVDPAGPREAEALNYLAAFFENEGRSEEASVLTARAQAIQAALTARKTQ